MRGGALPTYIPAKSFADTIIDLAIRGPVPSEYAVVQTGAQLTVASLRENIGRLRNPLVMRVVLTAIDHGGNDLALVQENLQHWFDSAMDRVSGRYKRRTHFWLFLIGLFLAIALNVNAITIARELSRNKALRETMVTRVQAVTRDTAYQRMLADSNFRKEDVKRVAAEITALELPIGAERYVGPHTLVEGFQMILGLLITALAITLGAPFWFDALNKMMVIRSTVKPREKSQEEGSEDRKADAAPKVPARPATVAVAATTPATGPPSPPLSPAALAALGGATDNSHEWTTGTRDEGII